MYVHVLYCIMCQQNQKCLTDWWENHIIFTCLNFLSFTQRVLQFPLKSKLETNYTHYICYKFLYLSTPQPAIYTQTDIQYCIHSWHFLQMYIWFPYYVPKTKTQDTESIQYSSQYQYVLYSKKEQNKEVLMMRWNIGILYLHVHTYLYGKSSASDEIARVQSHTVDCMYGSSSCIHTLEAGGFM